jgi:hypothetical protein
VDDSPVGSLPADSVVDDSRVGSVPADCSARRDLPALAVPPVYSSQVAHLQADFPASRLVDFLDDSLLQAMAQASRAERSLLAARMQADSPHASAAAVDAPRALPDFVGALAVSRRTMVVLVVECSSRLQDG